MIIHIYADPGHGWGKVTRKTLVKLGLLGSITNCSRQRGDHVFLEQDCDLTTLVRAVKATGRVVQYREHHTDKSSKIRGYASFSP